MKRKSLLAALLSAATVISMTSTVFADNLVWWGWTPGSPLNEQFVEEFQKTNPEIGIDWKQTQIDDYDAAIMPNLGSGNGVDIFEMSAGSANGGVEKFGPSAIDLTPALIEALGEDYADKLNEASISSMTVDGEIKALGVGTVYAGNLWINLDLFEEYEVEIPTDMDSWKAAVAKFEENGIVGFVQGAGQGAFNIDTFHAICDNVEPGLFTKAALGEIEWTDSESFVTALNLWKSLFDEGIMQPGALGMMQYPEANNLFMSKQAAMVMMGSWYTMNCLPDMMKNNMEAASCNDDPFTMIPINFPDIAGTGNVGYAFSDIDYANGVATSAADVDAATKFCVWLGASEEGQQLIADSLNLVPVLKSVTPNWDNVSLVNPEKMNGPVQDYLTNCVNNPENPRFGGISADLNEMLGQVLAGIASDQINAEQGIQMLAEVE